MSDPKSPKNRDFYLDNFPTISANFYPDLASGIRLLDFPSFFLLFFALRGNFYAGDVDS